MILDEPAAALDPKHTKIVNAYVDQLAEEGITVLIATHDIEYACAWADEIILMKDGTILKTGTPEEICADADALHQTNLGGTRCAAALPEVVRAWNIKRRKASAA